MPTALMDSIFKKYLKMQQKNQKCTQAYQHRNKYYVLKSYN